MPEQLALFPAPKATTRTGPEQCRRCAAPIRRHDRDRRAWVHTRTGRVRCTGTAEHHTAAPAQDQLALPLPGTEAA